jgi:hypothetical protein
MPSLLFQSYRKIHTGEFHPFITVEIQNFGRIEAICAAEHAKHIAKSPEGVGSQQLTLVRS